MSPKKQAPNSFRERPAREGDKNKSRFEYLIQWRSGLWTQIRQKEDAIWRFISFYAAAILLSASFVQPNDPTKTVISPIGILLTLLILFIVTYWGLLIVLDANYWFQRNLIFIRNIEREILPASDFGNLLPKSYAYLNTFPYSVSYIIHLNVLFTTLSISLIAFRIFFEKAKLIALPEMSDFALLISIIFSTYLLYVFYRDKEFVSNFDEVRKDAPGKKVKGLVPNMDISYSQTLISSPISVWGWSLSLLSSGVAAYLVLSIQPWFSISANLRNLISSNFYGLIILTQILRVIFLKKSFAKKDYLIKILHYGIISLLSIVLLITIILFLANTMLLGNII